MNLELGYFAVFLPALMVLLMMWHDSKWGLDSVEEQEEGERDKPWLMQKTSIGRGRATKAERWKVLVAWLVPYLFLFTFLIFD